MNKNLIQLSGSPGCVICDNNGTNPRSLRLKIFWNAEDGTVHIPCKPDETWCGYSSVVHGGVIASLMDEAMAWVVREVTGDWAFTAEYSLRFKAAVAPEKKYEVIAAVDENHGRKITTSAYVRDEEERIVAKASATFIPAKGKAKLRDF